MLKKLREGGWKEEKAGKEDKGERRRETVFEKKKVLF